MRNVEQKARICLLMGTWLEILDITHAILCGYDRFILCADDNLSASFACMYAIEQIAKQLIFVSITSQESLPVRRNRCSFKHALSLPSATVRSTIDCFRLFVRYLLVVRTLLDIPLGPISIPVAVGPYQKWTGRTPDFHVQRNCEGCIA